LARSKQTRKLAIAKSRRIRIAPELQELKLIRDLAALYEEIFQEWSIASRAIDWKTVPLAVIGQLGKYARQRNKIPPGDLRLLRANRPTFARELHLFRGMIYLERLIGEVETPEVLAKRRAERIAMMEKLRMSFEFIKSSVSIYSRRRGAPDTKRVSYMIALDYKVSHPETTWPDLAKRFCSHANNSYAWQRTRTLKAWCFDTKRRLEELGFSVDLRRPK